MFITERSIITDVIPLLVLLLVNLRKVTVLLLFLGLSRLGLLLLGLSLLAG